MPRGFKCWSAGNKLIADGVGDILLNVQSSECIEPILQLGREQKLHPFGGFFAGKPELERGLGEISEEGLVGGEAGYTVKCADGYLERIFHLTEEGAKRSLDVLLGFEEVEILAEHRHPIQCGVLLRSPVQCEQVFVQLHHGLLGNLVFGHPLVILRGFLDDLLLKHLLGCERA